MVMKSWIRTQRKTSDAGSSSKNGQQSFLSSPYHKSLHKWRSFGNGRDSEDTSAEIESGEDTSDHGSYQHSAQFSAMLLSQPVDTYSSKSPEMELLTKYSDKIVSVKSHLKRKRVLISSEHYFKLVAESYEQLKAVHYRASLEFSLAEWLYVHALLLYGKVQRVQADLGLDRVAIPNQIELEDSVPVFSPIAIALDTIGAVEDVESGILYVPDAFFPCDPSESTGNSSYGSVASYSTVELQRILNGTLYDWQRGWHRVNEARAERENQNSKNSLDRSPSELIAAIRETTETIAKIKKLQNQSRLAKSPKMKFDFDRGNDRLRESNKLIHNDVYEADLANNEQRLLHLIEEARDEKDYTIHPPCNYIYSSAIAPPLLAESSVHFTPEKLHTTAHNPESRGDSSKLLDELSEHRMSEEIRRFSTTLVTGRVDPQDDTEVAELKPGTTHVRLESLSTPSNTMQPATTAEISVQSRPEVKETSQPRILHTRPFQPVQANSGSSTSPKSTPLGGSPQLASNSPESGTSPKHVKLELTSKEFNVFVQYDSQLWHRYSAFVKALRDRQVAAFSSLRHSRNGTYAWMIPVKMTDTALGRVPALRLPRRSIPEQDQMLALILQASYASSDLLRSWYISMVAQVNMKKLLADYVGTAISERY